jgi:GntR family transcriptional regulator, transcriptional repressor for pyruvate dehydrogenase complex
MAVGEENVAPSRKLKVAEVTARAIGQQIVSQALAEGSSLPNERLMAEEFGVGRTTIREALRLLETQGVIRIKPGPGGGPVVRRPRPDDLVGAMTLILQFLGATLDEVAVAREAVEPAVAGLAAERITDPEIEALQATIDRMRSDLADDDTFYTQNDAFHALLARAAGNTVLLVIAETLERMTANAGTTVGYPVRTRARIADAHQRIVDALGDHDTRGAADEADEHMGEFRRYARRRYPQLLREPIRWESNNT